LSIDYGQLPRGKTLPMRSLPVKIENYHRIICSSKTLIFNDASALHAWQVQAPFLTGAYTINHPR
jgi:hypothetical protein